MAFDRFEALVIGSGLAGLSFALEAAKTRRVCILTKAEIQESNTSYAQGGIAAAIGETDTWELHERDTLAAGAGLNDVSAVRHLVQEAPEAIAWLRELGARFDESEENELHLAREGGHSKNRIVHHSDRTGWEVERAMTEAVRRHPNIEIRENTFVTDLILQNGRCIGASSFSSELGHRHVLSQCTLLATGGCGRLYQHTTNPRVATGDGIALGAAIGAATEGMEFMQFHPTTVYHPQLRSFLVTEAVRGVGATLRSYKGTRFMYDYDPMLELAPRDVVARAIVREMEKLQTWCVYLDMAHLPRELIEREFPTIRATLESVGIQIHKDWIPVVPAQHYSCGGLKTDLQARTNVPGLLAAGEVASTGVHGANRLASNSLLEAIVFARAGAAALEQLELPEPPSTLPDIPACAVEADAVSIRLALQKTMTDYVGIIRTDDGLLKAEGRLEELESDYRKKSIAAFSAYSRETANLLVVAQLVVRAAQARKDNIGLHYNSDHVTVESP